MAAALQALGELEVGSFIHLHHWREPLLLYERLHRLGCTYDTRLGSENCCEIFIWKIEDELAASRANRVAADLPEWQV
jgi:hypothetical protein